MENGSHYREWDYCSFNKCALVVSVFSWYRVVREEDTGQVRQSLIDFFKMVVFFLPLRILGNQRKILSKGMI